MDKVSLKIRHDALLLSYPDSDAWLLESKVTGPFGQWLPEEQPWVVIQGERRVGLSPDEARGKQFRLTGVNPPELEEDDNAVLLSYPVYLEDWQLESHSTLNAVEGAAWCPIETVIIGDESRAIIPAAGPSEFFRLHFSLD